MRSGILPQMPRYHAILRGSDLRPAKKSVSVNVRGRKRSEKTVDLHADSKAAAKKLIEARLPKGSDAKVVAVKEV